MPSRQEELAQGAARLGVALAPGAAARMLQYLDGVLLVNRELNLTSVRDPIEAVDRHLLDSLAFGLHAREASPRRVIDVGTGGGFPGIPIALAWPEATVDLVDSTRKKIEAVERIARSVPIPNACFHWGRAEDLGGRGGRLRGTADAVVARATGSLADLLRQAGGLVAPGGCIVAWKSDLPDAERDEARAASRRLGMESLPDLEYELSRKRRLVRFRRLG